MESETCSMCHTEKNVENFYEKHAKRKDCNSERGLKRNHDNKSKKSNQRKTYYEKKQR